MKVLARRLVDRARLSPHVFLTIDDGPTELTATLLETLERGGHRAILFVVGAAVANHAAVLTDAVQRGFALGNHSFTHPRFSEISIDAARKEIERTEAVLDEIYARAAMDRHGRWFRFPYLDCGGEQAGRLQELLRAQRFLMPPEIRRSLARKDSGDFADWRSTLVTGDWDAGNEQRVHRAVQVMRRHDVIELHDKPDVGPLTIETVCAELARRGWTGRLPR